MHAPTERLDEVSPCCQVPNAQLYCRWRVTNTRSDAHGQQRNPVLGNDGKTKALGASSILVLPIEKMME